MNTALADAKKETGNQDVIRILLVEDNPGDERLIRIALAEDLDHQYQITATATLSNALALVRGLDYDAILLDMDLPDSRGLANVQELALAAPRTPILVLTGRDDDFLAIQASRHGAQDYLVKGKRDPAEISRAIQFAIARKSFEAVLAEQAHFDHLTGLLNRGMFKDRLTHTLVRAKRSGDRVGLVFVDLDDFKRVNDSFGHRSGDVVLRTIAQALHGAVRKTDTVARMGGDEFIVILDPIQDANTARIVGQKILHAISAPIDVYGATVQLTASVGIALFPDHAGDVETLIESGDATMYFSKRIGGNKARLADQAALCR